MLLHQGTKPYFAFDTTIVDPEGRSPFVEVGTVRHRGIETSLAGHFGKRLNLVAGAVLMQLRVSGPLRDAGRIGGRPAGTPTLYARIDANYRTDIFGGLTPTATLTYAGSRAISSKVLDPAGRQAILPGHAIVDIGLRQQLQIGKVPASFRIVLHNVFDAGAWKVAADNILTIDERRYLGFSLAADF